jgi:hypothetical protein
VHDDATEGIIIIVIMNYISTRYNFTYTKINYVQDIKRTKGDLPTGRAHTSSGGASLSIVGGICER